MQKHFQLSINLNFISITHYFQMNPAPVGVLMHRNPFFHILSSFFFFTTRPLMRTNIFIGELLHSLLRKVTTTVSWVIIFGGRGTPPKNTPNVKKNNATKLYTNMLQYFRHVKKMKPSNLLLLKFFSHQTTHCLAKFKFSQFLSRFSRPNSCKWPNHLNFSLIVEF